jgi:glycerophosphoryl diester phosphodiesterase
VTVTDRWLHPRVVAHRGAGTLAPENTLAAVRSGYALGFRAVEFDVMLTHDEIPVLMHDATLGRTVRGAGEVSAMTGAQLQRLDAGSWFGADFAGEPVPLFADVAQYCMQHGIFMNVEIKPAPGYERRTGEVVAALVAKLVCDQLPQAQWPVLSSFSFEALKASMEVAPQLPRGHLFGQLPAGWRASVAELECVSVHCDHTKLVLHEIREIERSGYAVFCYTVNTVERAKELFAWGVNAICTDRLDLLGPCLPDDPASKLQERSSA